MGKLQRTKGATYEREVAKLLTDALALKFERVLGQARDGGGDVQAEGSGLMVECKRRKTLKGLYAWMEQARVSAFSELVPKIPVLAIRADSEETLIVIRARDLIPFANEVLPDA